MASQGSPEFEHGGNRSLTETRRDLAGRYLSRKAVECCAERHSENYGAQAPVRMR